MSPPPSAPTRSLPAQPSFEQLRKQAKNLLKAYRAGDATAVAEVERFERQPERAKFALADAQRVLARAYGFANWTKLKHHVEGVDAEAFCAAVNAGDRGLVRRLASTRPELVHIEAGGWTGMPLHLAVLNRDTEMVRVLMELGADARQGIWPHRDATTADIIARERGYDDVVAVIEQCEEARRRAASPPGATIDSQTDQINRLILRDRCDEAIKLLESDLSLVGACSVEQPINGVDCRRLAQGTTPLHVAARKHNLQMIAWLLDRGASVDARDRNGQTPLDTAATMAGWSAHGRDFSFMENSRLAPERFYETVRLLREHGAELSPRAAVAIGDAGAVRQMHLTGRLTRDELLSIAVKVNRIDMLSLLLDLGLDPNEPVEYPDGGSEIGAPLWFASMCGRYDIAELLITRGADVNAVLNGNGDAMCCAERTGDEPMQALLIRLGARITVERVVGRKDRETARAILDGRMPSLSRRDQVLKSTPLGWACRWGRIELVQLYLDRGADPVEADAEPWATPLAWATKHGHREIVELLRTHIGQRTKS
jgi:ankyrin repeat protein